MEYTKAIEAMITAIDMQYVTIKMINERLASADITDETYRALLKTKNEALADLQDCEMKLDQFKKDGVHPHQDEVWIVELN